MSNKAAFLDAKDAKLVVRDAPMPKAAAGRVLIKNNALAVNPVDWKVQDSGAFIQNWPMVLGEDIAGQVVEVGDGVTHVKKGDRVIAHLDNLMTQKSTDGGFALYTSAPAATTAIIPSSVSFTEGSVLPLAFDTAAVGLYSTDEGFLGLPKPSAKPSSTGKTIVVWGGSSSVGALVIQLAVASGVKVVATASKHNFDFCKKCGASEVIDYKSPSVVDDVVEAVKKTGGSMAGIYDAISLPDQSFKYNIPILEKLGGGPLATVLPGQGPKDVPASVKAGEVFGLNSLTHNLWAEYMTPALESGQLKCLPEPHVVGNGLEHAQAGLDLNKKGVSAKKVVIEV